MTLAHSPRLHKGGFDALLLLALFLAAFALRWPAARGDLWLDEADYALAATRGFQANRLDRAASPYETDKLIRLRHYHPPLTAQLLGPTMRQDTRDRSLRAPFVAAGSLSVSLLYLCALSLFTGLPALSGAPERMGIVARLSALACAVLLLLAPAHIRASSHALPWPLLILWLTALLWALVNYAGTKKAGWLIGAGGALGALFVTSEMFFVALAMCACAAPILWWQDFRDSARRRAALKALAGASAFFLLVAVAFWPAGLTGGAPRMLRHYVEMADDPWPVRLRNREYARAPKWAYLYWYARDYRPYLLCYVLGGLAALLLLALRRLTPGAGVLLIFVLFTLLSAHRAHIIGPEYLVHALPFLSLLAGLFFLVAGRLHVGGGAMVMAGACVAAALNAPSAPLAGMDTRAQQSRWPNAARYLVLRWQPDDRMLAPQYGTTARWYLIHGAGVRAKEWQVQGLPVANAKDALIQEIERGVYRFVAVGSAFADRPPIDPRIRALLAAWPVVWQSDERGTGLPRLVIYEFPRAVPSVIY